MNEQTEWNYEPCEAVRVRVIVADDTFFQLYWAREFVGQERDAVRVTQAGREPFYIDNEDGSGWHKVTHGGGPWSSHRNLAVEREVV
jgi:hypothetical protein